MPPSLAVSIDRLARASSPKDFSTDARAASLPMSGKLSEKTDFEAPPKKRKYHTNWKYLNFVEGKHSRI